MGHLTVWFGMLAGVLGFTYFIVVVVPKIQAEPEQEDETGKNVGANC
jgi:hypothetical protein